MNIECNLYQLEVGGTRNQPKKMLSPDIEIRWEKGYYATLGRTHHGLQTDYKNYNEIMEKCSQIATNIFELYDLLQKETNNKNIGGANENIINKSTEI